MAAAENWWPQDLLTRLAAGVDDPPAVGSQLLLPVDGVDTVAAAASRRVAATKAVLVPARAAPSPARSYRTAQQVTQPRW